MSLRAGRLRERVTLMRKTLAPAADGNGGLQASWAAVGAPIAAEVIGLGGREAAIGQALQGIAAFRVTIRYRGDVGDADQLAYQARGAPAAIVLNIRSASDPDGRRQQLVILADTGSAQAVAP